MSFTPTQKQILSIVPHITGFFSVCGSSFIIHEVMSDVRKRQRTYHRIMCAMSCFDVVCSFFILLSTWPIPRDSPGIYQAFGNDVTCNIQGFFIQLGIATPIYNTMLSVYYLLMIKYSMSEKFLRDNVEPKMHLTVLSIAFGTAISGFPLKLYNNANLWCWIAPLPLGCQPPNTPGDNCERGANWWIYRWALFYGPLWFLIVASMTMMTMLYLTIRYQENKSNQYEFDGGKRIKAIRKRRSKKVAVQAVWYVGAFYATWLFATTNRLIQQVQGKTYFWVILLQCIFVPMQGFLNFFVYIRPRFMRLVRYRRKHGLSWWGAFNIFDSMWESANRSYKSFFRSSVNLNDVDSVASEPEPEPVVTNELPRNQFDLEGIMNKELNIPTNFSTVTMNHDKLKSKRNSFHVASYDVVVENNRRASSSSCPGRVKIVRWQDSLPDEDTSQNNMPLIHVINDGEPCHDTAMDDFEIQSADKYHGKINVDTIQSTYESKCVSSQEMIELHVREDETLSREDSVEHFSISDPDGTVQPNDSVVDRETPSRDISMNDFETHLGDSLDNVDTSKLTEERRRVSFHEEIESYINLDDALPDEHAANHTSNIDADETVQLKASGISDESTYHDTSTNDFIIQLGDDHDGVDKLPPTEESKCISPQDSTQSYIRRNDALPDKDMVKDISKKDIDKIAQSKKLAVNHRTPHHDTSVFDFEAPSGDEDHDEINVDMVNETESQICRDDALPDQDMTNDASKGVDETVQSIHSVIDHKTPPHDTSINEFETNLVDEGRGEINTDTTIITKESRCISSQERVESHIHVDDEDTANDLSKIDTGETIQPKESFISDEAPDHDTSKHDFNTASDDKDHDEINVDTFDVEIQTTDKSKYISSQDLSESHIERNDALPYECTVNDVSRSGVDKTVIVKHETPPHDTKKNDFETQSGNETPDEMNVDTKKFTEESKCVSSQERVESHIHVDDDTAKDISKNDVDETAQPKDSAVNYQTPAHDTSMNDFITQLSDEDHDEMNVDMIKTEYQILMDDALPDQDLTNDVSKNGVVETIQPIDSVVKHETSPHDTSMNDFYTQPDGKHFCEPGAHTFGHTEEKKCVSPEISMESELS